MMNKLFSFLLLAMVAIQGTTAFTTGPHTRATTVHQLPNVADMPSYTAQTSTSLNLKVKVDPNAKNNNAAGKAKAAAYGGSIAIAALLPVIFIVWGLFNKGN